jgi:hypothetical protein
MEITSYDMLNDAVSKCPQDILNINISGTYSGNIDLIKCINLISIKLLGGYKCCPILILPKSQNLKIINLDLKYLKCDIDLNNYPNLSDIQLDNYNNILDLSKCPNLTNIILPSYSYTINISNFKNLNNIVLSPQNNTFNMLNIKKIEKLEEQLQKLTDIISNLKTNTSYFT